MNLLAYILMVTLGIPSSVALPNLLSLVPNTIAAHAVCTLDGSTRALVDVVNQTTGNTFTLINDHSGYISDAQAAAAQGSGLLSVYKVWDQTGNGFHATQFTQANQPYLIKNPVTGIWEIQSGDINGRGFRFFNFPEQVANNNFFHLKVDRAHGTYDSDPFNNFDFGMFFGASPAAANNIGFLGNGGSNRMSYYYTPTNSFLGTTGQPWDNRDQLMSLQVNASGYRLRRNPDFLTTGTSPSQGVSALWTANTGASTFFSATPSAFLKCRITAQALPDVATENAIYAAFGNTFLGQIPAIEMWMFGDSWFDGYDAHLVLNRDADRGVPIRVQGLLGNNYVVRCGACAGYTTAKMETSRANHFDNPAWRMAGRRQILTLETGFNDVFQGATAAQTLSSIQTWVTNAKTACPGAPVAVFTLPLGPGIVSPFLAPLQTLNTSLRNGQSGADLVIDLASQSFSFSTADGIHPLLEADVDKVAAYSSPFLATL